MTIDMIVTHILLLVCVSFIQSCWYVSPSPPSPPTTTKAPAPGPNSCKCGVSSASNKIVGGVNANKNEFNWQVALTINGGSRPFCGGSLISSRSVLTAAHCKQDVSNFKVVVGDHDVTVADGEISVTPQEWIDHPEYNRDTSDNDFAIITLASPVTFSSSVGTICLPSATENLEGVLATVTGWGTTSFLGSQPNILQKVNVNTMSNTQCTTNTVYSASEITSNMICAADAGKDSCQGDSGGPMVAKGSDTYYKQVGVVSFGYKCAEPNAPGVYARVQAQLDWIKSKTTGTVCSQ